jgi:prepilin-type N-terminal cleavage/methylation domain-containing protein
MCNKTTILTPLLSSAPAARRLGGFTLIELMVAVAIVAILAAIAIPAYSNYILRGNIPNATNGLSAAAAQMEQYFQDYRSYTAIGAAPAPPCATSVQVGNNFAISCTAVAGDSATVPAGALTPTAFTLVARPIAGSQMVGFYYTLDSTGNQQSVSGAVWGATHCTSSWIMKPATC